MALKEPDATNPSVKTEINPLLNPLLERNLGRWAQVYFTNPPETRDQKVQELLRELENEAAAAGSVPGNGSGNVLSSVRFGSGKTTTATVPEVSNGAEKTWCPLCHRENRAEQKFCGACGADLHPAEPRAQSAIPGSDVVPSLFDLSLPRESDVQYIRERAFSGGYELEENSSGRWKFLLLVLVVLLGALAYREWPLPLKWVGLGGQEKTQVAKTAAPTPTPTATPAPAAVPSETNLPPEPLPVESLGASKAAAPEAAEPGVKAPEVKAPDEAIDKPGREAEAAATPAKAEAPEKVAQSGASVPNPVDGQQELQQAERYLQARGTSRNTAEAARWLWKAVGKQNSQASVLLADLYARGDGVSKNCDQARLLLMAALKKGAPDASAKLRDLQTWGCR